MSQEKVYHENSSIHQENIRTPNSKCSSYQNKNEYSPYVIKQSNFQSNTSFKFNTILTVNKLPETNNKLYTPSPRKTTKEHFSDRYIPLKIGEGNLMEKFNMAPKVLDFNSTEAENNNPNTIADQQEITYTDLLKNNVLNDYYDNSQYNTCGNGGKEHHSNIFSFKSNRNKKKEPCFYSMINSQRDTDITSEYNRKINPKPYKTIQAKNLIDDFYLNLLDWSSRNDIAVGLGNSVSLFCLNQTKEVSLTSYGLDDKYVSGLIWSPDGTELAVGLSDGLIELYDVTTRKLLRVFEGHTSRVGVISWNNQLLASGSKDTSIVIRDARAENPYVIKYAAHHQEVCGLKWSFDGSQLASGGNDNKLMLWNLHSPKPIMNSNHHTAAVKAIAWSPHQYNLLATGGGTADRTIRFWNTSTCTQTSLIDTGSQVCNLVFSKTVNELVSTHGFSLNQIILWKIPSMAKLATLTGHTYRVLYLGLGPDGQNIVTGAGDESLRFWNMFPPAKRLSSSNLLPSNDDVR